MTEDSLPPSRIEIAKALRQMKCVTPPSTYASIVGLITAAWPHFSEDSVDGLSEEDEFVLLSLLMGTATHLAPLEQRAAVITGSAAPDMLARFQPSFTDYGKRKFSAENHRGYRCFVEVKSTKKDRFKMSGKALKLLREFAGSFGLPLVFAVRFLTFDNAALWAIVEDSGIGTVSVTLNDVVSGLRPVIWRDQGYLISDVLLEYTHDANMGTGLRRPDIGGLIGITVHSKDARAEVDPKHVNGMCLFLEPYNLEEVNRSAFGSITKIMYRPINRMLTVADLIYGVNKLPRDQDGNLTYDAGRILRELAEGQRATILTRGVIERIAGILLKMGVLLLMGLGEGANQNYEKWLRTGGEGPEGDAST